MRIARLLLLVCLIASPVLAQETSDEPIAYIGHGAFFDSQGRQIEVTPQFIAGAQRFYQQKLAARLSDKKRSEFASVQKRLGEIRASGASDLAVQQRGLDWLAANVPVNDGGRTKGKINALRYALERLVRDKKLQIDPDIRKKIDEIPTGSDVVFLSTVNMGQAYLNECSAASVPIPPPIGVLDPAGTAGWKSQGFIPKLEQFIVGTPAEVRTFQSPLGMCIALPRYSSDAKTFVDLDGVICLSKTTSKVCFWDNQMMGTAFSFATGDKIPIGVADLAVNPSGRYQGGGFELSVGGSVGGICTDCHAGENPYIIHPNSDLGGGVLFGSLGFAPQNLPMFAPARYDPIVAASWPQNALSHSNPLVPSQCSVCHQQGSAGRFPHLSNEIPGYCNSVLSQAINRTMPPNAPGSQAAHPAVVGFKAWCSSAPSSGPSDRGDPHLMTTNGIHYDFQSAGEFTTLRNSSTMFELQTRQTPVSTTFKPGPNPYTGLASCVSLNTAAALRLGKHRVTYQPSGGKGEMEVRIDGELVELPRTPIHLGGGNTIAAVDQEGGLDVHAADGTHVIVTPHFWDTQGYWYLNVEVLNTPAREGTMGHILGFDFLPLAPDGASFGPRPASIPDRHKLLNQRFADAWRVTKVTSLFDYASGTSTADFTNVNWPPMPGEECIVPTHRPVEPLSRERALKLCEPVRDKVAFENCVFDVTVMGDPGIAKSYVRTLAFRTGKTAALPADFKTLVLVPPK
jgi:hypothetical protein